MAKKRIKLKKEQLRIIKAKKEMAKLDKEFRKVVL
jgi:hypothetical protein